MFLGSCSLLVAVMRQRAAHSRRCMALLAASCRGLLKALLTLGHSDPFATPGCATELAHLFSAVTEQKVRFFVCTCCSLKPHCMIKASQSLVPETCHNAQEAMGAYCLPLLADYVVLVASPTHSRGSERAGAEGGESVGSSLPQVAWSSLRQGAYALYGACSSSEVGFFGCVVKRVPASKHSGASRVD